MSGDRPGLPAVPGGLQTCVVVPARDEEDRISACLAALRAQTDVSAVWEIIVVLDACSDRTAERVDQAAAAGGPRVLAVDGPGQGAGAARGLGMDLAAARLERAGAADGLIATTDADTRVAPDWLATQLQLVTDGAQAIGGLIELDPLEATRVDLRVLAERERRLADRLEQLRRRDPDAEHPHFAGGSLALTARTYRRAGGMPRCRALEDEELGKRLDAAGIPILRTTAVRVLTSPRQAGRAARGLGVDLAKATWRQRRRFRADDFDPGQLRERKDGQRVAVILPARETAATVGHVVAETVGPLHAVGLVDEVIVIDAASVDGTAEVAASAGARVVQRNDVLPQFGPSLGKGDAMWRALSQTDADIVCFLDSDTRDPHPHHVLGLLGPLLTDASVQFVKGAYSRPLRDGDQLHEGEGGRVTELMARPVLALHAPALSVFRQPLAGEVGGRRELLTALPFATGYGVEIAMLLDVFERAGLDAMAECWLGRRENGHQPLTALSEMAFAVLSATQRRIDAGAIASGAYDVPWAQDGRPVEVPVLERPPLDSLDLVVRAEAALDRPVVPAAS
ncbi:MAG: glucosyl-3-phosphoglycerate synthase [Solirubrobacteraceae bacterium]|nr:glucosyl-3-phosphoglycerate synthase [Solirubrobacteraceae bacterium]